MDHTDLVRDGWVRKGLLNKRAQGRGKLLRRINFKRRLFVITEDYLLYFEGSDLRHCTLKGKVRLLSVRAVENVDGRVFDRSHMFQVVHDDAILYLEADTPSDRAEWIESIREACKIEKNTSSKHQFYHPGVYQKNTWSCCDAKNTPSGGCQEAHVYYSADRAAAARQRELEEREREDAAAAAARPGSKMTVVSYDSDEDEDPDERYNERLGEILNTEPWLCSKCSLVNPSRVKAPQCLSCKADAPGTSLDKETEAARREFARSASQSSQAASIYSTARSTPVRTATMTSTMSQESAYASLDRTKMAGAPSSGLLTMPEGLYAALETKDK